MFAAAFAGVQEPWNAIIAAVACEDFDVKNLDSSGEENGEQTEEYDLKEAAAKVRSKHALRRLKARFPEELCDWSEDGVCDHQRPCLCGSGKRGVWPWVLRHPADMWGYCEVYPSCMCEEREWWLWASCQAKSWRDGLFSDELHAEEVEIFRRICRNYI